MTASERFTQYLARFPLIAVGAYGALVTLFAFVIWGAVADMFGHRADLAAARDILEQLQGRRSAATGAAGAGDTIRTGSPFLEGPTQTVAAAALLQRMAGAVTKVGGNVLSSQVELQGTQSKAGLIGVIASFELDQPALQQLLYDLEAGMPFLFIDQLVVQAPMASSEAREGRLRVLLAVYGQWQGGQ